MNTKQLIRSYIKDKDVFDIGCLGPSEGRKDGGLHSDIKDICKSIKGLDLFGDGKEVLKGNVETYISDKKYDVIIAGAIIEHLNNPYNMLDCCYENLKDDGILIITTPNAYFVGNIWNYLFNGKENHHSDKPFGHSLLFSKITLSHLLSRTKFRYNGTILDKPINNGIRGKVILFLCKLFPQLKHTLVFVCKK